MKASKALIFKEKAQSTLTHTDTVYRGRIVSVNTETVDWPEKRKTYDIVMHPGAVAMLPIDDKGRIIFVEQWRRSIKHILLEIPAGTLEEGEDPKACAARELQEEIGYAAKQLTLLGSIYSSPGFSNERIEIFLAEGLTPSKRLADDSESIDVVHYTLEEIDILIKDGKIHDAKTLSALMLYRHVKT